MGNPMSDILWDIPYGVMGHPILWLWDILWDIPTKPLHNRSNKSNFFTSSWTPDVYVTLDIPQDIV